MRKIGLIIGFLGLVICLRAQDSLRKKLQPDIDKLVRFTNSDYNMGRIPFGKPQEYTIMFTNTGKDTIALQRVNVGCGCTTPKYRPAEKIAPGAGSIVVLGFNGDAHGEFVRTADLIFTNGLVKQVRFRGITYTDSTRTAIN